ncbi:hypothetical protein [Variovorax saccharolyticus]|uniref:hypothetical protein n=1 Tax=Variovorax saccharolyticus TaxID=3053516 RepID=UPI002576A8C5|nr:hypothetical protein [Variovorax sp. J31P216]MDM0024108.1 hypothetical protein [Variovorax sp. J31P216]
MKALLLISLAVLAGCAMPLTPENSTRETRTSEVGSERTYRNLLTVMRECFPDGVTIEPVYFPEAKEGEITVLGGDPSTRIEILRMQIAPSGDKATVTFQRRHRATVIVAAYGPWMAGKDAGCPGGTRVEPPTASHNPYATAPR